MKRILLICIIAFFAVNNCKEKKEVTDTANPKAEFIGVILFSVGDVTVMGKKLKNGDTFMPNEILKIGKKSFADVQVLNQEITFRAKELTDISLSSLNKNGKLETSGKISLGSAIFNSGKLKQNEDFQVISPTVVMAVRGTKFEANVSADGKTKTTVVEGKVATRVNIPELESLSEADIQKSKTLTKLNETINSQEIVLEPGQATTYDSTASKTLLKNAGLDKAIENLNPSNVESVDKAVNVEDVSKKLSTQTNVATKSTVTNSDMTKKLSEYKELISLELSKHNDTKLRTEGIDVRNKQAHDSILVRISEIMGKAPETMILTNGEKVRGVIYKEADKYIVLTPAGQKEYKESEVDSVEF